MDGLDFKVKESSRLSGVGPKIGVNSKWYLLGGFSFFGDIDASILYAHFKTLHREYWPPSVASTFDPEEGRLFKINRKFHRFVPYARMFSGLEWDGYVNDRHQHIRLKLGYEVQYYWWANQIFPPEDFVLTGGRTQSAIRTQFENTSEDVMFYGVTGEFRLDF